MSLRLLIDMNLSPAWVPVLQEAGFDAVHWSVVGEANAVDQTLFAWARENSHMVFTHDLDFGAMLALTGAMAPSVFQIRAEDVSPEVLGPRAIAALRRFESELAAGALVVVDEARDRVRVLPLMANSSLPI
jgi:predicted nuclease of predicted toxin-antitoxin system